MPSEERLFAALKKFKEQHDRCHLELSKEINISEVKVKQFHYLKIIHEHGHMTFSQFAETLHVTKPSVTSIVNQLIRLNVVAKRQCIQDGRIYYVELSEKGKKIVQFSDLELERLAGKILRALTESEVNGFIRLIDKVVEV